jgi:hypothetical protein
LERWHQVPVVIDEELPLKLTLLDLNGDQPMPEKDIDPLPPETGEQIPARRHDAGSGANETVDGLDAATEERRHATEDTPSGTGTGKIEKTPVFDRADLPPKI